MAAGGAAIAPSDRNTVPLPITPPGPNKPGPEKPTAIISQPPGIDMPLRPAGPEQFAASAYTGITGVNLGGGGLSVGGDVFGIPVSVNIPFGGGNNGSEPASGQPAVPGFTNPASGGNCPQGTLPIPGLGCVDVMPGGAHQGSGMIVSPGEGATGMVGLGAVNPQIRQETVRRCPRGMVLGVDDLCYHKGALTKATRKWNPGRRPLLTGGDLNAISRAARAASRMKRQQKKLEKLGLLKKPKRGGSRSRQRPVTLKEGSDYVVIDTD